MRVGNKQQTGTMLRDSIYILALKLDTFLYFYSAYLFGTNPSG